MKMKNKIKLAAGILLGLAIIAVAVVLILKKPGSEKKKTTDPTPTDIPVATPTPTEVVHEDAKTIRLTLPHFVPVNEQNRRKFNEALYRDGHKYRLEVSYLDFRVYEQALAEKLEKGETDIVSLYTCSVTGGEKRFDLIKNGLLLELDKVLSAEKGKVLYEAFPKNLWETARYNGKLYTIPQVGYTYRDKIVVFNKDYIPSYAIEQWDGTLDGIYEMIKGLKWNDAEAARVQYQFWSWMDPGPMIGCDLVNGLVFDRETMSIENPLESEKYVNYMKAFDKMKRAGYIESYSSYLKDLNFDNAKYQERVTKKLEEGRFMVAFDYVPVSENYLKDNMVVKTIPELLTTRLTNGIGIASNTKDVDAVLDFLSLLYTDGKYANILLYGEEGVDYTVVDGVAVRTDDVFIDPFTRTGLNLIINTYTSEKGQGLDPDKSEIFAYYDKAERSPFFGFYPNTEKKNEIEPILDDFWTKAAFPKGLSIEDLIVEYRDKMKQVTEIDIELGRENIDRAAEYLESVRSQWEEFRK